MLSLPKIQEGHNSSLLILRRIPFEDLVNKLKTLLIELEGGRGVIFGGIAVLRRAIG
jgi:hypothetical protein